MYHHVPDCVQLWSTSAVGPFTALKPSLLPLDLLSKLAHAVLQHLANTYTHVPFSALGKITRLPNLPLVARRLPFPVTSNTNRARLRAGHGPPLIDQRLDRRCQGLADGDADSTPTPRHRSWPTSRFGHKRVESWA